MSEADANELIDVVHSHRAAVEALLSQPLTKPELVEECAVSRSTIDRWITQLEAVGLVHRPNNEFELTLFGQVVAAKFDRLRSQLGDFTELQNSLAVLADEVDVDPDVFETADVASYEGLAPELAEDLLTHPGRVRLVAPQIQSIFSVLMFREPDPQIEVEIVLEDRMVSQLDTYFSNQQLSLFSVADVSLYEIEDSPPFCLAIVERQGRQTVYVVLEGSKSGIGVVSDDSTAAVSWGTRRYQEIRDRATRREWPRPDVPFEPLRNRNQRVILTELLNGNLEDEADAMLRGSSGGDDARREGPLAALDRMGYVDWDRDTGAVSAGPQFETIRPVLELLETTSRERRPESATHSKA